MKEKIGMSVNLAPLKQAILNFVVPLVCIGVSFGLGLFVIFPAFKSLTPLNDSINSNKEMKTQLEGKMSKLKKLVDLKQVVKENSDLVDKVLVSESSAPMFLDEINQISQGAGFKVERLASSRPANEPPVAAKDNKDAKPYEVITASLSLDGTYDQLILFLRNIESASRVLDMNEFRYSAKAKDVSGASGALVDMSIVGPYLYVTSSAQTDEPITFDISSQEFVSLINKIKGLKYYEFSNSLITSTPEPVAEEQPATPPTNPEGQ